ncbi:Uncharacterised protein [Yersinia pseudotuberculosis]|nr:Uncharacterised protein [Yersinia pseudotuberculosis]
MIFTDIQQLDAHVLAEIGLIDQRLHTTPGRFHPLEIRVMHHCIQLATDLVIQRRNVAIQQGFIQLFHFFRRLLQQVQKDTDGGGNALIGGGFRQRIVVLERLDTGQ